MTYIAVILLVVKLAASGGTRNTNGGGGTRAIRVALLVVYRRTKLAGGCEINGGYCRRLKGGHIATTPRMGGEEKRISGGTVIVHSGERDKQESGDVLPHCLGGMISVVEMWWILV